MRNLIRALVAVSGLLAVVMAHAIPITWDLSGVTYDDGSTAIGTFVYDADTALYSDVSIVTSSGPFPGSGSTYDTSEIVNAPFETSAIRLTLIDNFGMADLTNQSIASFIFVGFLSNDGGVLDLGTGPSGSLYSFEGVCTLASCQSGFDFRNVITGGKIVSASSVPEPSVLLLLGSGVIGIFGVSRRKARA